jgi:hypothetical protein
MTVYGRGSEWRRWDLHVHAPGTALEDQFGDWDEYVTEIERADPAIAVVGITDYASIQTYKTFLNYRGQNRMKNIILAFPNIEFRISPETKKSKGINLHLLINPDDKDHVLRIDEALSRLTLRRADENIPCTKQGLIRLGNLTKLEPTSDEDAFLEGVKQFKVEFDQFRQWWESEQWLCRNSLIALAGGSNDGASGLTDSGFLATRRELCAFANMIFSGNPKDREAWLGRGGIPAIEFRALGVPKPVVHGSDAHSIDRLFRPDMDRYCWIKADPTFEGFRQILYEPDDRVWIGDTRPTTHESHAVIESISISNTSGWFDERKLPLNSGLVAIVGLKGSGKTALADLIAFAGGAAIDPHASFISRAGDNITGLTCTLQWRDGLDEIAVVPDRPGGAFGLEARYLSQRFVDRLCSGDSLSDELLREVESVIFEHLPVEDRMEAEDFAELRAARTLALREERNDRRDAINADSREIAALDSRRREILAKSNRRKELPRLLDSLQKALPIIDDKEILAKLDQLKGLREQRNKLSQSIAELKATKQQVQDIERKIAGQIKQFTLFWGESEKSLRKLGFSQEAIAKLRPVLPFDFSSSQLSPLALTIFQSRYSELDKQIKELEGTTSTSNLVQGSTLVLDSAVKKLEDELKLDEAKKKRILEIQQQQQTLTEEQHKLEAESAWVEKTYRVEREEISSRRMISYLSYFDLLNEERQVLEDLYAPLKTSLSKQGHHERKLDMVCRVDVDSDAWIARGEELFDLRKSGTSHFDDIRRIAGDGLQKGWQACDKTRIADALNQCLALIKESEMVRSLLKTGYQPLDVANWLFGLEHVMVTHGIKYEGKDLRLLSPGTKGIVLLILYLAVDHADTRPLIIDQPDENLDNQSTYEILRGYFREAKKRRQIIIITHNPNLVVNTDAEQIVVARADVQKNGLPYIRYSSGGLEALKADGPLVGSVRDEICRVLEGGKEAFKMRELRYRQDRP